MSQEEDELAAKTEIKIKSSAEEEEGEIISDISDEEGKARQRRKSVESAVTNIDGELSEKKGRTFNWSKLELCLEQYNCIVFYVAFNT